LDLKLLNKALDYLCCPDDGSNLENSGTKLICTQCRRDFVVHQSGLIELLPKEPYSFKDKASIKEDYLFWYKKSFLTPFIENPSATAWGMKEAFTRGQLVFFEQHINFISKLVPSEGVLCDVASGDGKYIQYFAKDHPLVFHCDLSVNDLNYSIIRAWEHGLKNVVFIRCDYLQLPFQRDSLDIVLCLDALVRGWEHEKIILKNIHAVLKNNGIAIADFHSIRPAYLRAFINEPIFSYSKEEIRSLADEVGIFDWEVFEFGGLPSALTPINSLFLLNPIIRPLTGPTRYILKLVK